MSDVKLFKITNGAAEELVGGAVKLEKQLQTLVERHLEVFLHVRFVASEYSTGKTYAGRIDTLGLDENYCPTIIEYKRNSNANVINQGLFYLAWLMDHKAEFQLLVLKKFGQETADKIDWSAPRLLCLAEDFTRYDKFAVEQNNRNIGLIRYVCFGSDLLLLDLVNVATARPDDEIPTRDDKGNDGGTSPKPYATQQDYLDKASPQLKELYEAVKDYLLDLGDDVQENILKWYIAFKRLKNIVTFEVKTQSNSLLMWLPLDPDSVKLEDGFSRDMRGVGHHGTGDLELTIRNIDDLEKAKPLIQRSFDES